MTVVSRLAGLDGGVGVHPLVGVDGGVGPSSPSIIKNNYIFVYLYFTSLFLQIFILFTYNVPHLKLFVLSFLKIANCSNISS